MTFVPERGRYYQIVASHSGKVFDVAGGSPEGGAALIQWARHDGANQQFCFEPTDSGYYCIVARHSGMALDVIGGDGNPGAAVIQWPRHGGPNQQFRLDDLGDGKVRIVARHSGHALDVYEGRTSDGAALIQWPTHGGANQAFSVTPVAAAVSTPVGETFVVSKARGPGGRLLVLVASDTPTQYGTRQVNLGDLNLQDEAQVWIRRPLNPDSPRTFWLQNKKFGHWLRPMEEANPNRAGALTWLYLTPFDPRDHAGDHATWHDDNVAGPYNAIASFRDWEQKINIRGDGPYSASSSLIMWAWSGGAVNELWRFWERIAVPRPGARIFLTSFEFVVQLGARPDGALYMHPNRADWEAWSVEDAGAGQVYLRSAHGTYLGSRPNGEVYATQHRDVGERWILSFGDGIRVRSANSGLNLGARPDGTVYTHANYAEWQRWWTPLAGRT